MLKYCSQCRKKVAPTDKFCKNCGATLVDKNAKFKKLVITQAPKPPSKPSPVTQIFLVILFCAGMGFFILVMLGIAGIVELPSISDLFGEGGVCPEKSGYVSCGYCAEDVILSGNPNAGKCWYCPKGTPCVGTPCSGIQCGSGGGGGEGVLREYFTSCTSCQRVQSSVYYRGYDYSTCNSYWQLCYEYACASKKSNCA